MKIGKYETFMFGFWLGVVFMLILDFLEIKGII